MIGPIIWMGECYYVADNHLQAWRMGPKMEPQAITGTKVIAMILASTSVGISPEAEAAYNQLSHRQRVRHDAFIEVLSDLLDTGQAKPRPNDRVEVTITRAEYANQMAQVSPGIWGDTENPSDILRKEYWTKFIIWPGSLAEPWED
jgi:hypothetical protein